jgi:hypothetical protein
MLAQYTTQATQLTRWDGDACDPQQLQTFIAALEDRLMPRWADDKILKIAARLENEVAIRKSFKAKVRPTARHVST